jgi:putative restriction endonuclease
MGEHDRDTLMRLAAFEHVRRLSEIHDHLTANELKPGFIFDGERRPVEFSGRGKEEVEQDRGRATTGGNSACHSD